MRTVLPSVAIALVAMLFSSLAGKAGELSERVGSISDALNGGYQFIGGTGLGPELGRRVLNNGAVPEAKYHEGYLYLLKDKAVLICLYRIVTYNPAEPSQDYIKPNSQCFAIK
jgi:hypothetical protein